MRKQEDEYKYPYVVGEDEAPASWPPSLTGTEGATAGHGSAAPSGNEDATAGQGPTAPSGTEGATAPHGDAAPSGSEPASKPWWGYYATPFSPNVGGWNKETGRWEVGADPLPPKPQHMSDSDQHELAQFPNTERYLYEREKVSGDETGKPDRQKLLDLYSSFVKDLEPRVTPEEQARRERGAWALSSFGHLGNALSAVSNLIFAGKAPSQRLPEAYTAYKDVETLRDKLDNARARYLSARMNARAAANGEYANLKGEYDAEKQRQLADLDRGYNVRYAAAADAERAKAARAAAEYAQAKDTRDFNWDVQKTGLQYADKDKQRAFDGAQKAADRQKDLAVTGMQQQGANWRASQREAGETSRAYMREQGNNYRLNIRLTEQAARAEAARVAKYGEPVKQLQYVIRGGWKSIPVDYRKLSAENYQQLFQWLRPEDQKVATELLSKDYKNFCPFVLGQALKQGGVKKGVTRRDDTDRAGAVYNYLVKIGAAPHPYDTDSDPNLSAGTAPWMTK